MSKLIVTGASGDLGRRVTARLKERVGAENLVLVTRTPESLADIAKAGASVRFGDYDDPASLDAAYAGGDRILIISGLAINRRVAQHRNAINAAKRAGLKHIVYTSTAGIHPANPTLSAQEHIVTEDDVRASGIPFTVLRNATYAEVIATLMAAPAIETGIWDQVEGGGALAPVSKEDIAASAAEVLAAPDRHVGAVYEISGPELMTFADITAIVADVYGVPIAFKPVTVDEFYAKFDAMGIPRSYREGMNFEETHAWPSDEMVSASRSMGMGFHAIMSHHVKFITGRAGTPLRTVVERAKGKRYDEL